MKTKRTNSNTDTTITLSSLPCVSIHAPSSEIANCLQSCDDGVLLIQDLPKAPFAAILNLLQNSSTVTHRLNQACPNNVVIYKDSSYGEKKSNSNHVDRKCTLDISPERLESIAKVDPEVIQAEALQEPLSFFQGYKDLVNEKLIPALAEVIGGSSEKDDLADDVAFSYRMIDYYPSEEEKQSSSEQAIRRRGSAASGAAAARPRLAEHRDFGFLTLIQASLPGLQVRIGNEWKNVPAVPQGTAILMGGWCAKIRTNGRMSAILHRVPKHFDAPPTAATTEAGGATLSQNRRISAVLFCYPKRVDTSLDPVVRPGETRKFIQGVNAATLQQRLAESKTEKSVDQWLEFRNSSTATSTKTTTTTRKKNGNKSFWSRFRSRG